MTSTGQNAVHPPRPRVVVAAGGTLETALLPYHLTHLAAQLDVVVAVALSEGARRFVSEYAIEGLTGNIPYTEERAFHPRNSRPLHLLYSEADVLVVYPASARIVVECATGVVTCPVTRLFAFTPKKRVIFCPAIHPQMTMELYERHLENIALLGCCVLASNMRRGRSVWPAVEKEFLQRGFAKRDISSELISLDSDSRNWLSGS